MKSETGHITSSDGLKLFTRHWLPEGEARKLVMIIHGYAEHSGRYEHVARVLTDAGCAVYTMDHRGHGQSEGMRVLFDDFNKPVDDFLQYIDTIRISAPFLPLYILAHSAGTLVALSYAYRRPNTLAGMILSGCAVNGDEVVPSFIIPIVSGLQRLAPTLRLIPGIKATDLSRDPATLAAHAADPYIDHGAWRLSTAYQLVNSGRMLRERAAELDMPLLILHGEADSVTPISGSRLIHERASSPDKTLITYPGMLHEIFNEVDRERVLNDLSNWIENH